MSVTMDSVQPFIVSRQLDAPLEKVWRAWTDESHMSWWGPKGIKTVRTRMDLRPGGTFHYGMQTPDGNIMWGRWAIRDVQPRTRLVYVTSFSDEAGGLTRHPMAPTWPLEMLTTVTFEEKDGGTFVRIEWIPINASEVEVATFDNGRDSMTGGWGGTLDQLTAYLASPESN